jgi:hypothetical protein
VGDGRYSSRASQRLGRAVYEQKDAAPPNSSGQYAGGWYPGEFYFAREFAIAGCAWAVCHGQLRHMIADLLVATMFLERKGWIFLLDSECGDLELGHQDSHLGQFISWVKPTFRSRDGNPSVNLAVYRKVTTGNHMEGSSQTAQPPRKTYRSRKRDLY